MIEIKLLACELESIRLLMLCGQMTVQHTVSELAFWFQYGLLDPPAINELNHQHGPHSLWYPSTSVQLDLPHRQQD